MTNTYLKTLTNQKYILTMHSTMIATLLNAVQIDISNKPASVFSKCGQVIYGMSSFGELVSVVIINMSVENIAHTKAELAIGIAQ